ncbi:Multicopper oxidase type 2 [Arabidopsis thaliana x Arabidopsis arenosa]|uniref:L-ascorbate oxidase n=1 Tax=Arabidopsis thaliana x Arabidopsis arenosa TaxID=1240361 RepID=A0A8T1XXU8_9BRAS|nr:Multicopper oxidase type 2 [Arabidopsis thaliana x Arabidopsis arenosa]
MMRQKRSSDTIHVFNLMVLCFIALFSSSVLGQGKIRRFKWEVKYEFKSPDCFEKLVITVNGKFPGPTIKAQQGDTIVVELKNSFMTENAAVHWHGIRQIGTPWFDGVEGVTQCPILPGEVFTYQFVVDRPGTYMYHSHYGMQRESGLIGMIQVSPPVTEPEPFTYDYDRNVLLTDWYHKSMSEKATGLASIPFKWVGEPQSLLIQGRGRFNCSNYLTTPPSLVSGVCNASNTDCSRFVLTVIPGKTYRLRIGSLTALSALSFQIEGHNLTVVEADGNYVEPFTVKNLFLYSGETYSVLLKADQNPRRNYWITTSIVSRPATTPPAIAVLNYYSNHPRRRPPTLESSNLLPKWNDTRSRLAQSLAIKARRGFIHAPPENSDKVIVLLNTQNEVNGYRRWSVNNVSYHHPKTPYLIALKQNLTNAFDWRFTPPENYDSRNYDIFAKPINANATTSDGIYRLRFNSTVDVILQNANTMNANNSETHPWHLHGHDFWVLGYGEGKFNESQDPKRYNRVDPIMKNTVAVQPFGWTALRFRADNPGVWSFHCHIESHFFMGMGVVFESGIDKVSNLPSSIMGCGQTKR